MVPWLCNIRLGARGRGGFGLMPPACAGRQLHLGITERVVDSQLHLTRWVDGVGCGDDGRAGEEADGRVRKIRKSRRGRASVGDASRQLGSSPLRSRPPRPTGVRGVRWGRPSFAGPLAPLIGQAPWLRSRAASPAEFGARPRSIGKFSPPGQLLEELERRDPGERCREQE